MPPYVHYAIVPATQSRYSKAPLLEPTRFLNAPVSGVSSAKMMHDFGVSRDHTVIMDLPLSLDPLNLLQNKPVVSYNPAGRSRFGVFPRYEPDNVTWFETSPCCIFHTANTWDSHRTNTVTGQVQTSAVNLLACRLTSASLVFSAGDLAAPIVANAILAEDIEPEQCRLYYYQFELTSAESYSGSEPRQNPRINHQWALSAIPFEFPTIRDSVSMSAATYIYGCSVSDATFGAALGRAVKIDSLVKVDVETLIARGICNPPQTINGCVDTRNITEILSSQVDDDPIKVFKLPSGWYAQESRFVPRKNGTSEDDGWLLSYVFDESQLDHCGECPQGSSSELWIIDAKNMTEIVAKVFLPQRVPYGLHGNWFSEQEILDQRPTETIRALPGMKSQSSSDRFLWRVWMAIRGNMERILS